MIDDAAAMVDALLRQRSQRLERQVEGDTSLQGDALRLTQVFVNLFANANKFAPENSVIRVGARREGGKLLAWVDDAGPGLPPGTQDSIFERFVRGGVRAGARRHGPGAFAVAIHRPAPWRQHRRVAHGGWLHAL